MMAATKLLHRGGWLIALLMLCCASPALAQQDDELVTENVFLITTDGLRWQEVFTGADADLVDSPRYVDPAHIEELTGRFWRDTAQDRREALMPFFWNTIAKQGQILGNRHLGSKVNTTNQMWFSYPGYNEILTGLADDQHIASNDPIPNPNVTVLEFINEQPEFKGEVAAFAKWGNMDEIINANRSGIPVVAGLLADRGVQITAMKYLKKQTPRVLYVSFGRTDHVAHAGDYEAYLDGAHNVDSFIEQLWKFAQSHKQYKGKTTLIITTDHGRGLGKEWRSHGRKIAHADEMWIAVLGPDTAARGEKVPGQFHQSQVARTLAAFLSLDYKGEPGTGKVLAPALLKE